MHRIKKNDEVIVTKGKDTGRRGKVLRIMSNLILVEGINKVKKHQKPNPKTGAKGGIVDKEAPIQISNVAILNSVTQKADRVGFRFLENGKKVRCFKSNNETIDV